MRRKLFFSFIIILFLINFSSLWAQKNENPFVFSAAEGRILLISENASGTLLAVSDGTCVTIYNKTDYSLACMFYDENVSKLSFYTEGETEFFADMTKGGQFIVRKLYKDNSGWHCEDGEPFFSADCNDASGRKSLTAVSFSNNSDYVAAAFDDNTVQVHFRLRVTAGSISHTITNHKALIYGLEFSRTGEYIATVSTDGMAYVWNSYTSSLITQLKGIYTRARVPVCFTEDSVYIVSLDGRNSFRISDFSGNTLYSILTGRPITAIKPLKDPDLIAIRNDKNEVMVYSISSRRPVSVATVKASSDFTSFDFTTACDQMYAGFADGKVSLIEPAPYLDDTSMLVTDSTLAGHSKMIFNHFQSVSVSGGVNVLNKPFLLSVDMNAEYRYCEKTAPWFFGGGLQFQFGIPGSDFPVNYKIYGLEVNPPKILSFVFYVPAGLVISPWNNGINLIAEVKTGVKLSTLVILSEGYIVGNPVCSFYLSTGVGVMYKNFESTLNIEYDTVGKLSPSLYAGYVIKFGGK